ncbi:thioredoxin family protein [Staphylococcus saprophyticus]|jgi:thiol-disulfide isomerase/thioredoxin|uniref:Putative thioredoxin n=1 Tax=Staphylococcus saprophyticus subsp. saprophyticus (strain ATCC 15305 / DSM 20229 / NCIMB 8711 / NCTC 7292 / S-41) TaxID=342451 RepID=Q49W47_STAS1|nr:MULTISPECIES: thioredoxin family protein [Staphylococcus]CRV24419.1 Thioredoxin [Streptococcus equi subsp. equi]AMG20946.1 thioredoxin [Staphylococcus saprophyticus]AMG34016.1 thioredoxin [Staphylococcus saprophyticus]ASE59857.1 thioredoxin [Staphylococcus saprophyticus]ASF18661.1 thioredoxin [Staphylococcus saprophyticus]
MKVTNQQRVNIDEHINQEKYLIFGYTPTCGTCKVSERMLDIANEILKLPITKIDLNFHPDFSQEHEIQSVPVLMLMSKGEEQKRIYAFQSVPNLLENLK